MDGSGRRRQPPRFLSHTQYKPREQACSVPVCRWAICGAPLTVPGLANPGPTQLLLHRPSGQLHPLISPFGYSLWTVSVFESHPLNFIFLCGHLEISSCRDKALRVGLLLCACGPWWEVVPHSPLPEAPIVLASIFSASSIHLCQSDGGDGYPSFTAQPKTLQLTALRLSPSNLINWVIRSVPSGFYDTQGIKCVKVLCRLYSFYLKAWCY